MLKKLKEGMALGVGIYLTFMLLDLVLRLVIIALAMLLSGGPTNAI